LGTEYLIDEVFGSPEQLGIGNFPNIERLGERRTFSEHLCG